MARIDSYNQKTTLDGTEEILGFDTTSAPAINIDIDDLATYINGQLTLGTASSRNVGDFATSAQGLLANTAIQPSDLTTSLSDYILKPTGQSVVVAPTIDSSGTVSSVALSTLTNSMMTMGQGDVTQSGDNTFTGANVFDGAVSGTGFTSAVNSLTSGLPSAPDATTSSVLYELQVDTSGVPTWEQVQGGDTPITIDTALSGTSTNAVENRVIDTALGLKRDTTNNSFENITLTGSVGESRGTRTTTASTSVGNGFLNITGASLATGSVFTWENVEYTLTDVSNANLHGFTPNAEDEIPSGTTIEFFAPTIPGFVQFGTEEANRLEDYEEGTWTPTGTGIDEAQNRNQAYSRIGNTVTLSGTFAWSGSSARTFFSVGNLPFTVGPGFTAISELQGGGGDAPFLLVTNGGAGFEISSLTSRTLHTVTYLIYHLTED